MLSPMQKEDKCADQQSSLDVRVGGDADGKKNLDERHLVSWISLLAPRQMHTARTASRFQTKEARDQ